MSGVLYARVDGQWVPLASGHIGPYDHPPAYIGPRRDGQPTLASFSHVDLGGSIGYGVEPSGTLTAIVGQGQRLNFFEAVGPLGGPPSSHRVLGSVYWGGEGGVLDIGGLSIGDHPTQSGAWHAGIWPTAATAQSQYLLLNNKVDNSTLVNSAGTLGLRINNVDQVALYGTHTSMTRVPVRVQNVNLGVGDQEPANGQWSEAHLFTSSTSTHSRIAMRGGNLAVQLRAYNGQNYIGGLSGDNTAWMAFAGLAYINQSSATIKRRIRTLRPQRERIVVQRDPRSDEVEQPDIMALRPVAFRMKVGAKYVDEAGATYDAPLDTWTGFEGQRERLGLIAEDVAHIIPSAVAHNDDGTAAGIMYDQITVALLDHVQRLTETVETLRYRIAELEARP